jgi:hypothetical protein
MAGWALVACESAARAGARAALAGAPIPRAARAELPAPMRAGASVDVAAGHVVVRVSVPTLIPGFTPSVTSSALVVGQ